MELESRNDMELRILKNHIELMPKVYRKRNQNWVIVKDLLQAMTSKGGRSSSISKCYELGLDPDDYQLENKEW